MTRSRRSIRVAVAAAALLLGALAAAPEASADTPPSYCGGNTYLNNHTYAFDHTYISGGHLYFQYSTLVPIGDNYYWNGQFSYQCDGNPTPVGAGSYVGQLLSYYDHSYVSGGIAYFQYSTLVWDGSNWQWNGFVSHR
ncbi:hypothetical protein AB0M29_41500 [Streptomyces sp. NPDC051976]|uniref:hypothetical protein n=1 Tax=Streptomyces sp. NPDC051976 TaxID=3154947 RepID=UPI00343E9BDC